MRRLDVAVLILEHERPGSLQHAGAAAGEPCGMTAADDPLASRFDADEPHVTVVEERVEDAHGVTAAADAGDNRVGKPAGELHDLRARFAADDRLKFAHHPRI